MFSIDLLLVVVTTAVWEDFVMARDSTNHVSSLQFHEALQHLEVDVRSGSVFIGATNRIYHFREDLELIQEVETGPVLDNVQCTEAFGENPCSSGGTARFDAALMKNVNKILVVDSVNGQLITCGSAHQGICQTRSLVNISLSKQHYNSGNTDYFIAANHPESSTVAFIGRGPTNHDVLYVAATYTDMTSSPVRQTVPAVSSRNLVGSDAFRFAFMDGLTGGTFVRLRREAIEKYLISYVAGFSIDGFSYFLTNQPESFYMESSGFLPVVSTEFVSKVVQVCQNDRTFYSYVEMPLGCRADGREYHRISAATVVQPGFDLAKKLQISVNDHVLLATFTKNVEVDRSYENDDDGHSVTNSALCLYRLVDVRQKFTQNIQKCFSIHQKHVGLQFGGRSCVLLVSSFVLINVFL